VRKAGAQPLARLHVARVAQYRAGRVVRDAVAAAEDRGRIEAAELGLEPCELRLARA
jgi:hypothetical protein